MRDAHTREGQGAHSLKETDQSGFSIGFDELIADRGEAAVMIEGEDLENLKITGYTLPRQWEKFSEKEVRNAFLAQSMMNPVYEDSDREKLAGYLDNTVWQSSAVRKNEDESVYLSSTVMRLR